MTRDHASADELHNDIQQMRAPDQEALEDEIVQGCEDLNDSDWVAEKGRDADAFQTDVVRLLFATNKELGIELPAHADRDEVDAERMAQLRERARKEFKHYAHKRAERELQ